MKGLLFCTILPALFLVTAQTQLSAQCLDGNCRNGYGLYRFPNGDEYVGNWSNGRPHGNGKYKFSTRERYEGEFRYGKFEGTGTMYYPDGAYYTGSWKQNVKNGLGRLVFTNGTAQEGSWVNGKFSGSQSATAATSQNTSQKPKPNQASKPKPSGKSDVAGLINCTSSYCRTGRGYYDYPDGSRWIGEFKNGVPNGEGVCYYAGGDRYEGQWANGAPNGEGVIYAANGRVTGAVWVNGAAIRELDSNESMPTDPIRVEASSTVKIYAVVVGVGRYTSMPSLKFTDDDAYRFYSFLKSPEGGALPDEQIAVLVDESATRENVLRTMRQYFLKADANDVVLFYFSGHGLEGCFLPVDFDGYNNKLRHEEIKQILMQSKAKHKLCIADACHSGTLNYGLAAKGTAPVSLAKYYQAFEDSSGGVALLMSSKGEELSLEDHGLRQGVFTYYMLRGLKGAANTDGDNIITIRELFNYVYARVREYTTNVQTPVLTGAFDDGMPVAFQRY
ncbi:MAG: caspase family protein [Lewinellaceae bacterium]|nr:caspase family protein [Saprospiraceae bacterium]MCB9332251.1 caspase family protein [Lewinellaceae bacterium]